MSTSLGKVIIVDDDAAVRNSLKFALELEGFDVRVYEGGPAMLAHEDLNSPGCLVVDQYMPGMTGIELVDRLREQYTDIPAILITAKASNELRLSAALRGVRQVLEKPLEDNTLFDTSTPTCSAPVPSHSASRAGHKTSGGACAIAATAHIRIRAGSTRRVE